MHPMNKYFDKIFYIIRSDKLDKAKELEDKLKKLGIEAEPFYGNPLPFNNLLKTALVNLNLPNIICERAGYIGNVICNSQIIQRSKDLGYKRIFIFEHETSFRNDFNEVIEDYLNSLPEDFDICYLFSNFNKWNEFHTWAVDDKWFSSNKVLCTNAYGINSKFYDKVLNSFETSFYPIDLLYYFLQDDKNNKFYSSYPNLCSLDVQYDGASDGDKTNNVTTLIKVFDWNPNFGDFKESDYQ